MIGVSVRVCVNISFVSTGSCIMNMTDELVTLPFDKVKSWACFGMTRVDTKFKQGLDRSKSASVYMG